jgi:transposase
VAGHEITIRVLVTRDPGGYHATYSTPVPLRPYRPGVGPTGTVASVLREARAPTKMACAPRIADAVVFYLLRSGCAWRMLPREYPPWKTVYYHFRKWRLDGRLRQAHERLRAAVRQAEGRNPHPSGAVIDSQAVKGSGVGGPERGYDGAKRLSGRKRHLLVDTNGLVLSAHVHAASLHDRDGAQRLLSDQLAERLPRGWRSSGRMRPTRVISAVGCTRSAAGE